MDDTMKTITIRVPKSVTRGEIERLICEYLRKKNIATDFYDLMKGENIDQIEREAKDFRKSFKLRDQTH